MRLIDADVLLERMKKAMESGSNLNGTFHLHIEHAPTIVSLPSAEPKTGHAEMASSGVLTPTVWAVCSECKKPIDPWDNYCRSCGARMKGGAE